MDDIQNDQEPSAQESGTDMGKTEVPAVPSKQNDDQQSNKLPLPFALNFSILMASKPMARCLNESATPVRLEIA
ncbi:hypothetical protein CWE05_10395 [Bifidobacterium longum]|uniref:Uncharacterized protein n=1 Tax=Bifidobacterium longum TaxID=216816 RepID=A0A2U2RQA0_BIFLN|nr:hypothetical protein CWE05_10395 [Bifidobacterium longum]